MAAREMSSSEDESAVSGGDLRRGPWTVEEDLLLVNYIAANGEGRWNALARCAGLKRTGKSCRLRWLNYLRPDLRRGNITAQEQLVILELHARWGNRWSKIAQHLPGRTDNEIKNYWRTRVQKHARQLGCDVNSHQFKDIVRQIWMPRLLEQQQQLIVTSGSNNDGVPLQHQLQEVSCVTTATSSSSSSMSSTDDGGIQQQPLALPPLVVPPPAMYYDGDGSIKSSMSTMNDTWCHPLPTHSTTTEYNNNNPAAAAETCSWSDVFAGLLPDLPGETVWGADDLWYTQLMGL